MAVTAAAVGAMGEQQDVTDSEISVHFAFSFRPISFVLMHNLMAQGVGMPMDGNKSLCTLSISLSFTHIPLHSSACID